MAGDPARPVSLEVTLFKPSGPGPFPLAVMNHGATGNSATNRGERYRFTVSAYYFLSRGYAVALPMMRGFAGSGGTILHLGCDLGAIADGNARDIGAVVEALARRPDIDRSRIVVAGQSFGAWNTLGVGAAPPAGVRGLISFNATLRASDCPAADSSLISAAGQFGARTSLPSLWFYGDNDSLMPVSTWQSVFDRYKHAGARAELVDIGRFKDDSHQFLSSPESLPLWAPKVDAFLARIGMPSATVYPDYLPAALPPATHWASLSDAAAVPFLSDQGRVIYQHFLDIPEPRAFVIAPNGSVSQASRGYDPLGFALRSCGRMAGPSQCKPYAVNDDVVWSGPKQGEPTRVVAKAVHANASTSLGAFFEVNRDCSSRGLPKVAISAAPGHGTATVAPRDEHPAFPPSNPLFACNTAMVRALGVMYTPAPGYAGTDALTIDEVGLNGQHQVIRVELSVS